MANVGNLFVNFSGNTKGLTKSLASAKGQIDKFDKQIGRRKGDSLGRAKGRFESAMKERKRFKSFIGPRPAGESERMGGRIKKKEKEARQAYRQEQRNQTITSMRKSVAAAMGVFGLTIAGVSIIANKALQQVSTAKAGAERFQYLGPQGGEIIKAKIDGMMADIAAAKDPVVSQAFLDREKAKVSARKNATAIGATAMSITADEYFERIAEAFASAIGRGYTNLKDQVSDTFSLSNIFSFMSSVPKNNAIPVTAGAAPP
jgi:hypothetical protein